MRKFILSACLLTVVSTIKAQDLIVTTGNDTINAQIAKEHKKGLHFYYMKNNEIKSTLLLHSQILSYQKGFYQVAEVPKDAKKPTDYDGQRLRIGSNAGFGYRIGKIEPGLDAVVRNYIRKLKSGFNWDASAHYIFRENYGIGANYSSFKSTETSNDIQITFPNGTVEQGISDEIGISYVGPSFLTRIVSNNKKHSFVSTIGVGYIWYTNTQKAGATIVRTTGNSIGLSSDLGYEIRLAENLSAGIKTMVTFGAINKATVNINGTEQTVNIKEELGRPESLSVLDLSLGLRLYL